MGVHKSTYVGPYLEATGKLNVEVPKIKRVCPNHPKKETNDVFCSTCGTKIESVKYTEVKTITAKNFLYDFEDSFWQPEYCDVFIPNESSPNKLKFNDEDGGSLDLSNYGDKILSDIEWFNKNYIDELTALKEKFGEGSVKVKWGVVTYWS